jgi:hypothetical protein
MLEIHFAAMQRSTEYGFFFLPLPPPPPPFFLYIVGRVGILLSEMEILYDAWQKMKYSIRVDVCGIGDADLMLVTWRNRNRIRNIMKARSKPKYQDLFCF